MIINGLIKNLGTDQHITAASDCLGWKRRSRFVGFSTRRGKLYHQCWEYGLFFLYRKDFKLTNFLQKLKQELQDAGKAWTDLENAKKKDEQEIKVHLIIWLE